MELQFRYELNNNKYYADETENFLRQLKFDAFVGGVIVVHITLINGYNVYIESMKFIS